MNKNHLKIWIFVAIGLFPLVGFAMTSTNYQITWDDINVGGTDQSSSSNYYLDDSIGGLATGDSTSSEYSLSAGYRIGDNLLPYLSFDIGTQNTNIQSAWTAFSNGGLTVTVADDSGFATGTFIGVIENEGFGQLVAIGKIASILSGTITVDSWVGDSASLSSTPAGSDDYVYPLTSNGVDFGLLYQEIEYARLQYTSVTTNAENGYTVSVIADTSLESGSQNIHPVEDGEVTVTSEEYGIESVGSLAVSTDTDIAIPTSTASSIQTSASSASDDRMGIIYKLSIDGRTPTGNYSQTVRYRVTGNF